MTPAEHAAAVYSRESCARTFREDVEAHMLNGYVVSTPEMFVLFRPVNWMNGTSAIVDPWFEHEECDTWHIYLFAGDVTNLGKHIPYPLPRVSFERNNVLRVFSYDRLDEKIRKKH